MYSWTCKFFKIFGSSFYVVFFRSSSPNAPASKNYYRLSNPHLPKLLQKYQSTFFSVQKQKLKLMPLGNVSSVLNYSYYDIVQRSSLEAPYGVCGKQPLYYYDANAAYTSARCKMECMVTSFVEKCGCKDAFMPGNDLVTDFGWVFRRVI